MSSAECLLVSRQDLPGFCGNLSILEAANGLHS
jgi:hypothetical protein